MKTLQSVMPLRSKPEQDTEHDALQAGRPDQPVHWDLHSPVTNLGVNQTSN